VHFQESGFLKEITKFRAPTGTTTLTDYANLLTGSALRRPEKLLEEEDCLHGIDRLPPLTSYKRKTFIIRIPIFIIVSKELNSCPNQNRGKTFAAVAAVTSKKPSILAEEHATLRAVPAYIQTTQNAPRAK